VKKEEDFSANASKKMPAKKIQFLTGDIDPLRFHCWHGGFVRSEFEGL
jgi:hypothetical protein